MRIKTRVRTAMAAQAAIEGRFLGGRPPYGYQLVDAGPHPNPAKAAIGQRLRQLAPDPVAAPVVQRIFAEYVDGRGLHADRRGPQPRRHPLPVRPRPRPQPAPRQPGRASGRSRRSGRSSPTPATPATRSGTSSARTRCSSTSTTSPSATSPRCAGTPATSGSRPQSRPTSRSSSRELFDAAQAMFDRASATATRTPTQDRHYVLAGRMRCGVCGRRMQGHWNHGRAYYRCKFTEDYPDGDRQHPRNIYVKEDAARARPRRSGSPGCSTTTTSTTPATASPASPSPTPQPTEREARAARSDRRLRPQARQLPRPARPRGRRHRRRLVDRRHPTRAQAARAPARPARPRRPAHQPNRSRRS